MDLLTRPRDEACRVVALHYLDEAAEAKGRLESDPEGLHDLRVALRRFRSTLRAWHKVLGRPRRRQREELRRIVDATSEARDAEVLLTLLAEEQVTEGELVEDLRRRKEEGYAHVQKRLSGYEKLDARLRRRLALVELDLLRPHKMAQALAELVDDHADDVEDDLFELRSPSQVEVGHAARISVKRLRYLVEPFKGESAVDKLVKACKALQDLLGDLHDTHIAIAQVGTAPSELASRLQLRVGRLWSTIEGEWLGDPKVVAQAHALAGDLRQR